MKKLLIILALLLATAGQAQEISILDTGGGGGACLLCLQSDGTVDSTSLQNFTAGITSGSGNSTVTVIGAPGWNRAVMNDVSTGGYNEITLTAGADTVAPSQGMSNWIGSQLRYLDGIAKFREFGIYHGPDDGVTLRLQYNSTDTGGIQSLLDFNGPSRTATFGGAILAGAHNTLDLGLTGTRFRTGYFGTSVVTPSVDSGAATDLILKYSGSTRLTIGSTVTVNSDMSGAGNRQIAFAYSLTPLPAGEIMSGSARYGQTLTNEGATARSDFTLPTASNSAGKSPWQPFIVQDADGIRITAAAGDTIRMGPKVTAAAGYIQSTTIGSVVTLVAINATEWVATKWHGTWTDGTFTASDAASYTP